MKIREQILEILREQNGKVLSGHELGDKLGISRSAVWRHIKILREQSYPIRSGTNSGYVLDGEPDIITAASVTEHLTTRVLGRGLDIYRTIDSTNSFAKSLAELGAKEGRTIIADSQQTGRGQYGKSFLSPAGKGIYMSVIVRPKLPIGRVLRMTAAAAVAVCDALQKVCELETGIKWVNDVYSKGSMHKLCGILSESSISMETGKPAYAIIGIGLNVNNTSFPPEIKKVATSVFLETNRYYSRSVIAAEILNALERRFDQIDGNKYIEDYRRLSVLIGREVRVSHDGVTYSALVTAIDDDGQLVLESELGHIVTLSSGSVSLL